jgi:hypothetical protein
MSENITHQLENQIRNLINIPHRHFELRQNNALFSQLCSSLDVIEDTEDAITAFKEKDFGQDKPSLYLTIYGLLQAIFVQQDAVVNLCEALGIKETIDISPNLKEIREIRNDSIGHPTKRKRPNAKVTSYHHITQVTLGKSGFNLTSYFSDGSSPQFTYVDISSLINEQSKYISAILTKLVISLELDEKKHRDKYRMEKLSALFPKTLDYYVEKLLEGVHREEYIKLSDGSLDIVITAVHEFLGAIKRRDMELFERIQDEFDLFEHATTNLRKYYAGINVVGDLDAKIYIIYLNYQLNKFKELAEEIDRDY